MKYIAVYIIVFASISKAFKIALEIGEGSINTNSSLGGHMAIFCSCMTDGSILN